MGKKDKAKPNTVRSSSIETARRDQVNMPSPSESLGSEQVGHADTSEDNNYAEEAREIFDQPVESSKFVNPPGGSIPPEHSISESINYPTRQVSLFEEPDGFGIIQSWENNPVMEGQDTTSSNDMIEEETIQDAVPPSSSTKESPRQRKKPGKKEAAVTPKKKERWWTWENVKIPPFLYAPELLPTFVDFYESGATVEREGVFGRLIFGCSNLNDAVFCTMKYDDSAVSSCVFSVFKYGSTEQEIREMIKELQADCLYKRETGEDRVSQLSLSYLQYFDIKALDHKVVNFPDALYYCELCDYHINNIGHFRDHMRWNGPHIHALEIRKQRLTFVREMPIMLKNQRKAINRAIEDVCSKETPPLKRIADDVRKLLLERLMSIKGLEGREPDLQLMGSVLYDAFNPGSDINFSLQYENVDPSDVLCLIHKIKEHFNETESFKDFSKIEFMDGANGAHPRISMMYHDRISILVSWWATEKVALGKLLKRYTDLHPSIPKLMISIRHWAKLCDLCASYGLVKHGFDIMVIHVLQLRGVIPFITDGVASPCSPDAVDLAVEFVAFFAHYSMKLDTVVQIEQREPMLKKNTKWNNKIFQIKNPIRDDNVVYFPRTFQPYFLNCFLATFIYLAVPRKNNQPIIDVNLMIPDINRKKENERQQQRPVNSSTPAATPRKTNESHDAQAPTKQPVVTAKEPAQPVSDPRLEAHERRWQQEGKRIEEDPVEFLKNQLDQELATPSGKKKNYNRNRTRSKNKAAEQETKINADFPTTQVNGVNLYQLQAGDVEICGKEVYNRAAFSEVFIAMPDLENDGYVLNREFLKKLSKNKILKRASFRAPHSAYKRYSEVYFPSNVKVEKPILEDAEIRIHKSVEMDSSLEDKMTALSLKNDDQPEVNSSTVLEALEAALPNVSLDVTHEDEKLDVTISVDGEDEEKPAMTEQSQGSEKEEEVVMSIEEPTKKRIARDDFKIRCDIWPLFVIFQRAASWTAEEYSYDLDTAVNFTGGWLPEVKCSLCDSNKHQNADCSEMKIPPLVTIAYERPVEEDQKLTEMIHEVCQRKMMTPERIESILQIVKQLEDILRPVFPDVRLDLFGSLYNGFGTTTSDADICFRFASDTPPEGVNVEETLCVVSRTLKKMYGSKIFIMNIMQAKVPIVKFNLKGETNKEPIFDGDISYYNSLALANTRMLYEYTKWDSRVAELGVWVKTWANSLFINDASKGSLSSYSYVVMTIHYLQELNPPVLPRLQEDFRNDAPPELQDEHDIYYYKNGWEKDEPWSKNTMSLSELFIGFLDFYSRYDYNNQVIQIRRSKPLSKLEKEWNKPICLEDPFDLKHNLGAVVNQRMFFFILKTFRKSREIFMNKVFFDSTYLDISNWLLNDCSMGRPPLLAKQCFYCGRMNHTRENCPRRIEAEKINADTRGGSDGKVRRDGRNQNQRGGGGRSLQNRDNGFRGKGPRRDI